MAFNFAGPKRKMQECDKILTSKGMLWEMEDAVIDGQKHKVWKNQPPTWRAFFLAKFEEYLDRPFISAPTPEPSDFYAREDFSYRQIRDLSLAAAAWLRTELGVFKGSYVGIGGQNSSDWVIWYVAIHLLGAVPVIINATWNAEVMAHSLGIAPPMAIVASDEIAGVLSPLMPELARKGVGKLYCWQDVAHLPVNARQGITVIPKIKPSASVVADIVAGRGGGLETLHTDDDGTIFYTSGTTGYPKAVLSSQRAALHNVVSCLIPYGRALLRAGASLQEMGEILTPKAEQSIVLVAIPFFHVSAVEGWLIRIFLSGWKMILMRRWSTKDAITLVKEHKISVIGGVPAIVQSIIQSPLLPKDHVFEGVSYGGAPPPERMPGDVNKLWPTAAILQGYGMTETSAMHTSNALTDYLEYPSSVGPAVPICGLKIVDQNTGKELGVGKPGLILMRGPNIMKSYLNNPEATRKTIDAEGWLDSGDIGYVNDEGFLFIGDRAKDIIIRGGENIASAEVENALYLDSRIAEAAAVPVPDPILGERVGVAISLAPGATATSEDIIKTVSPRLRYPARPVIVVVSGDLLPRNANGKLLKTEIKKIVQAEWKAHHANGEVKARL
ncbi:putative 4-coumarate--CoA ligase 3 [Vanrija pseudolonga]|uniref:4-coumarate--CoA ligase 3 n=1 Tax=Vanrija pseudolonga TaxID=143232 RepID=A0AAF0XZ71_9TREE|nr:putative 4-coumarate--CoA ligase 3 [Vanrija pseudolonga]